VNEKREPMTELDIPDHENFIAQLVVFEDFQILPLFVLYH